ncbi:MAG TPA: HAMP domain-containing sensor histidine kinase [Terriglobales bacterium]|jgi:signal transduction histidine kinase|nr:HAMP domain-containing sensor histidine kinase [Terriglobales bacterium]
MTLKRHWNERTRLMLTLELAVVLPAAVLVLLSVIHVNSIQRDKGVQAAFQRDFSHVLKISEKQINQNAYELADDVRTELPGAGEACSETMDRILASHPYVAHLFLYDPDTGLVFRSQPYRSKEASFHHEGEDLSSMMSGWMQVEYKDELKHIQEMTKKGDKYSFFNNWTERGDKHLYQSGVLFVAGDSRGGNTAIAGFVFDAEYLRDRFLPENLNEFLSHQDEQGEKNHVVMMIHPKNDSTPLAASAGWDGGYPEVERNMEGAFPGLTMAIKLPGTTLAALEQHFVRTDFLILGVISLLLAAGIVLTHRNISREMALARLKSDFVSNVSHELRTPLSLIRLYAETLEMGRLKSSEKAQEYYSIIRKESERLSGLINNILDFSRIEAGRKEYDFRETDLRELVHNTLESYRYQIEQNGFAFEENIAEDVPPMRVDREAVARSLLNLVNNALKYSQDRKFIGVNLFRDNGSVRLEVTDHGIGIPESEQAKIFEKFYRVGDPLVHNTKGSGLGLSLVRHIVLAHGGEVRVESAPGRGSTFTITLPVNGTGNARKAVST